MAQLLVGMSQCLRGGGYWKLLAHFLGCWLVKERLYRIDSDSLQYRADADEDPAAYMLCMLGPMRQVT